MSPFYKNTGNGFTDSRINQNLDEGRRQGAFQGALVALLLHLSVPCHPGLLLAMAPFTFTSLERSESNGSWTSVHCQ
jgi:hypothetical protein